jgi:folylpolyglutamate synthase/dihydropteroate synthase
VCVCFTVSIHYLFVSVCRYLGMYVCMYVRPYVLAYLVMNMIRGRDYASSYDILEELLDVVFFAPVPPRATRPSTVAPAWRETGRKERLSFGSMACSGRERERECVCV